MLKEVSGFCYSEWLREGVLTSFILGTNHLRYTILPPKWGTFAKAFSIVLK